MNLLGNINSTTAAVTTTGAFCTVNNPNATNYTIVVDTTDGTAVGASVSVQVAVGAFWVTVGAAITANTVVQYSGPFAGIRLNLTAITSGTVNAAIYSL